MKPSINKKNIFTIYIPTIHIVLSLLLEAFTWGSITHDHTPATPISLSFFSLSAERILFFVLSKAVGTLLIFLLWKYIYTIILRKDYLFFIPLIIYTIICLFLFPSCFFMETDNPLNYVMACTYYPEYWHSVYIGLWYNSCLMVLRHPISICLLQSVLYVAVIHEIIHHYRLLNKRWVSCALYIFYILPENFDLCFNPYRNNLYTIFILALIVLFIKRINNSDYITKKTDYYIFIPLCALLVVMRGEGIAFLLAGFGIITFLAFRSSSFSVRNYLLSVTVFFLICILFSIPQKIGETKYYGSDYKLINHMESLSGILQSPSKITEYETASEDLALVDSIVPLNTLKSYGLAGFRAFNYSKNGTINQTFLSHTDQNAILSAIHRLETNNLLIVKNQRLTWFIQANRAPSTIFNDISSVYPPDMDAIQTAYNNDLSDCLAILYSSPFTYKWLSSPVVSSIGTFLNNLMTYWFYICARFGLVWTFHILSILVLFIAEIIIFLFSDKKQNLPIHLFSMSILAMWMAIFIGAPEMRYEYYYSVFFASLLWDIFLINESKEVFTKQNVKKLMCPEFFASAHMFLSLLIEFITLDEYGLADGATSVVRNIGIPFYAERLLLFVFSKIAGFIIIYCIWKYIFILIKRKDTTAFFLIIFFSTLTLFSFPQNYLIEQDNAIVYRMSVSYYPEYWNSVYTQIWYNACLTVFRHPFMIPLIQTLLFTSIIREIYLWFKNNISSRFAYVLLIFYFLPENKYICFNPYRNNIYAILCIAFLFMVFKIFYKKDHVISPRKLIPIIALGALLTVMRGEGIAYIFAVTGLCIILSFHAPSFIKSFIPMICLYIAFILFIRFPQAVGETKYYGKDYQMLNHMRILSTILSDPSSDMSYDGAEEDINAINTVVPFDMLVKYGETAYRSTCYINNNNNNMNQSKQSDLVQKEFLNAASNIELHNFSLLFVNRLKWFIKGNYGPVNYYYPSDFPDLPHIDELKSAYSDSVNEGILTIGSSFLTYEYWISPTFTNIRDFFYLIMDNYMEKMGSIGILWILRILTIICLIIFDLQVLIKIKDKRTLPVHLVTFTLLVQWAAIFIGEPEMRFPYYYAVYYNSLLWCLFLFALQIPYYSFDRKKNVKKEQNE